MAEVESKIRIVTEYDDQASAGIAKTQAVVLDFSKAAEKAGKDVSKAFEQQANAAKSTEGTLGSLFDRLKALRTAYLGFAVAVGGATLILKKSIGEASEYEQILKRLVTSLGLIGISSKLFVDSLKAQANAIQATTQYSDEAVLSVQQMLVTLGASPSKLKLATQAVVDFAAATGKSLPEAAEIIGRTFGGQIPRGLGRVTSELHGLTEEQLKAGEGVQVFARLFAGSAAQNVNTFAGIMAQAANTLKDLFRAIGEFVLQNPVFLAALAGITAALKALVDGIKATLNLLSSKGIQGRTFIPDNGGPAVAAPHQAEMKAMEDEVRLADKRIAQEQKLAEIAKNRTELAKARKEFEEQSFEEVNKKVIQSLTNQQDVAGLETKRMLLKEEMDAINLDRIRVADEFRLQAQKKKNIQDDIDTINETIDKLHAEKLSSVGQTISMAAGGNFIGLIGKAAGPFGAIASGITELVLNSKDLPEKIHGFIEGLAEGIGKGIPMLIDYLSSDFIPDLVDGLAGAIGNLAKGLPGIFIGLAKGALRTSAAVLTGGLSEIFGSLFGGPNYYTKLSDAIAEGMDRTEFSKNLKSVIDSIKSVGDVFKTPEQQLTEAQRTFRLGKKNLKAPLKALGDQIIFQLTNDREISLSELPTNVQTRMATARDVLGVRIADPKKFQEAIAALGEELKKQAETVIKVTQLQIEMKEKALEPIRETIQKINSEISRLQGLREQSRNTFAQALDAVSGALLSPQQTVASLQQKFQAATGEAKGQIGGQLASALQSQFENAKALAAQGAISGEELKKIQADILGQLQDAQGAATSEFDRLIEIQNQQLTQAQEEEAKLLKEIDDLKTAALKQIDKLDDILTAIENNDIDKLINYFKTGRTFASGTAFVEASGPAMLHRGEAVIPAGKGGGVTVNINGVPAGTSKDALTRAVREILIQNIGNFRGAVQKAAR